MGARLAKQVADRWPHILQSYKKACKAGQQAPGRFHIESADHGRPGSSPAEGPRFIINFPTKRHWKNPSQIEDIALGLKNLPDFLRQNKITSVAIPPLGCGLGGLNWKDVHNLIISTFKDLEFDVHIYGDQIA